MTLFGGSYQLQLLGRSSDPRRCGRGRIAVVDCSHALQEKKDEEQAKKVRNHKKTGYAPQEVGQQETITQEDILECGVCRAERRRWRLPAENGSTRIPLEFVRFEPYVIPKKSLTGDSTERVDTRVLQVIYRIRDAEPSVYVGQQMDVYIDGSASRLSSKNSANSGASQ